MYSFAIELNKLKGNKTIQSQLLKELERQFIHEQYIKHDVVQVVGTGNVFALPIEDRGILYDESKLNLSTDPLANLIRINKKLTFEQLRVLADPKVHFALANYRAIQFESNLGFDNKIKPNMSCSEIISSYNAEALESFIEPYQIRMAGNVATWSFNSGLMTSTIDIMKIPLNFQVLDSDSKLCELLKTPNYYKGSLRTYITDGPGCSGCAGGWLTDSAKH
jgi:hypothetical protein